MKYALFMLFAVLLVGFAGCAGVGYKVHCETQLSNLPEVVITPVPAPVATPAVGGG